MPDQALRTLLGGQTQLDVRSIERELMQLWRDAAEEGDGERATVTRTCVLNLLVVAPPDYDATPTIARLTDALPSRAIVITIDPQAPDENEALLDAWVQAHCQLPAPGRPQVCCEQITLTARGEGIGRVPGTILPLLLPDMPVAVWFPNGAPFDNALFRRLAAMSDRMIVDSRTFAGNINDVARLATMDDGMPALADLVWGRLTLWREQLAQCFDAPALTARLAEAEALTIVAAPDSNQVAAYLLAGWLASRLGWNNPDRGDNGQIVMQREGGQVRIAIQAGQRALPDQMSIECLSLACVGVSANVELSGDERLVTSTEVTGRPALRRSVRLPQHDTADLLADELRLPVSDPTYVAALRAALQLLTTAQPG